MQSEGRVSAKLIKPHDEEGPHGVARCVLLQVGCQPSGLLPRVREDKHLPSCHRSKGRGLLGRLLDLHLLRHKSPKRFVALGLVVLYGRSSKGRGLVAYRAGVEFPGPPTLLIDLIGEIDRSISRSEFPWIEPPSDEVQVRR